MIPTPTPTNGIARDSRAVSEVIGAVLIFALVLLLLAVIQVTAIPVANQQAEYEHNQRVLGDFQDLGGAVDRAATLGTPGTSSVEAGFRYTSRFPFLNPPSPSGAIETDPGTFVVRNANATNAETRDYLTGDDRTFETNALVYTPGYNEYRNAPVTRYEGWTLYNEYEEGTRVYTSDGLVADRRISLTSLDGGRSGSAPGAVTIETSPVSGPSRTVSVRGQSPTDPVTIELTTGLSADRWSEMLADEPDVEDVTQVDADTVAVVLAYADDTGDPIVYDIRLAKVGVGPGSTDEDPHYLTTADRLPLITGAGGPVTVELRDRFNAPVPGEPVVFTATDATLRTPEGETGTTVTVTTDEDGRASVAVVGPTAATVDVTATADVAVDTDGRQTERGTVEFDALAVGDGGNGGGGGEFNPNDDASVLFVASDLVGQGNGPYYVDVTFNNTASGTKTIAVVRMNAYMSNTISQGNSRLIPAAYEVSGSTRLAVGGPYTNPGGTFDADLARYVETTHRFEFFESDGGSFRPDRADVIVYSVRYTDGTSDRYFIQIDDE